MFKKPVHLVVLVHGFQGSREDFPGVSHALLNSLVQESKCKTILLVSGANEKRTTDGIHAGGERLFQEVLKAKERIEQHKFSRRKIKHISFICHSLGGLYVRYCIGRLHECKFFDEVEPVNYITLATPHLGSRNHFNGYGCGYYLSQFLNFFWNYLCWLICKTTQQLVLYDDFLTDAITDKEYEINSTFMWKKHSNGEIIEENLKFNTTIQHRPFQTQIQKRSLPLIYVLSKKNTCFTQALSLFRKPMLYSNVDYDIIVNYQTSSIQFHNPFSSVPSSSLSYHDKYPLILSNSSESNPNETDQSCRLSLKMVKNLNEKIQWTRIGVRIDDYVWSHRHITGKLVDYSKINKDNLQEELIKTGAGVLLHLGDHFSHPSSIL